MLVEAINSKLTQLTLDHILVQSRDGQPFDVARMIGSKCQVLMRFGPWIELRA